MKLFETFNELIFPNRCLSCRVLGDSLCTICRRDWKLGVHRREVSVANQNSLSITSSVIYSLIAQKILLAAKESQIEGADELVIEAISHSVENLLHHEWIDLIVPIPSRRSAVRARGRQFIADISRKVGSDFCLPVADLLTHARAVRDQSGLHIHDRWNNLAGALVVRKTKAQLTDKSAPTKIGRVLLLDDLVTTGATLSEAARALGNAGIEVAGAVTAAAAKPVG